MKNIIKKLSSILCLVLIVMVTTFLCTACGNNDNKGNNGNHSGNETTTITLTQAKEMIVNALATAEQPDNRNIFLKMGTADINFSGNLGLGAGIKQLNGIVQKTAQGWKNYQLDVAGYNVYYDGEHIYGIMNGVYGRADNENSFPYFNATIPVYESCFFDLLFTDDAWRDVYHPDVTKTLTDNGYTVELNLNMAKYVDYALSENVNIFGTLGSDIYQTNQAFGKVKLKFEYNQNNEIIKVDLVIKCATGSNELQTTNVVISKHQGNDLKPSWYEECLASFVMEQGCYLTLSQDDVNLILSREEDSTAEYSKTDAANILKAVITNMNNSDYFFCSIQGFNEVTYAISNQALYFSNSATGEYCWITNEIDEQGNITNNEYVKKEKSEAYQREEDLFLHRCFTGNEAFNYSVPWLIEILQNPSKAPGYGINFDESITENLIENIEVSGDDVIITYQLPINITAYVKSQEYTISNGKITQSRQIVNLNGITALVTVEYDYDEQFVNNLLTIPLYPWQEAGH